MKNEEKTQFERDWAKPIMINGKQSNIAYYNLICSIRDLGLHNIGMKPHRFWKISDVKRYFGIKGNKHQMLQILKDFRDSDI